jgi:tetratricopeptide (TPR) repeat protein
VIPSKHHLAKKSFTQDEKYDDQLAMFAVARSGEHDPRVFHCHGWLLEPETMVITESDYQRWYLRDETIATARYRQTLDLIFGSNPLIFVGFSLQDDDLLVALRMLSAVEPDRKFARPLFALLEKTSPADDYSFEQLYDRYGIHVLPYPVASTTTPKERGEKLCEALQRIDSDSKIHREQWLLKPKLRIAYTPHDRPSYFHYEYRDARDVVEDTSSDEEAGLENMLRNPSTTPRVLALIGPGGAGKSWLAMRLVRKLMERKNGALSPFRSYFFWSSYYINDALTGIDRALSFLRAPANLTTSRLDRLKECLAKDAHLLVFDGVERFLHETGCQGTISPNNSLISKFLEVITDKDSKSTVILTSRLLPTPLQARVDEEKAREQRQDQHERAPAEEAELRPPLVKVVPVRGFDLEQARVLLRDLLKDQEVESVVSWLSGHRYGLALAKTWLAKNSPQGFKRLRHIMAQTDPEGRLDRMIGLAVEGLPEPAAQLLEQLALFPTPISMDLVKTCLGKAAKNAPAMAEEIKKNKLVFEVMSTDADSAASHYAVHPTVREYIYRRIHHSAAFDFPNLALSGFTSGADVVYPGNSKGVESVTTLVNKLVLEGNRLADSGDLLNARYVCRGAFGVVRARMVATAVPLWSQFDNYLRIVVRVIDLARRVSTECWDYRVKHVEEPIPEREQGGPLYGEEVAWLYNEAGLAYYAQGSMMDAIAVWEQGYEINKLLDSHPEGGHNVFQSWCNLGAAHIHFGKLRLAEAYLRRALDVGRRLGEGDHVARVTGYLGVLNHVEGNLKDAIGLYDEAIKELSTARNLRALSIFHRHRGDALIKLDTNKAGIDIQTSRAIAEYGRYPDLMAYARLSEGHLHRANGDHSSAVREYSAALRKAQDFGIHRLEAEAQSELARVALALGDAHVARRRAMKSLQIANENDLGLRQTHAMVILGKAMLLAGDVDLGRCYLNHAKRMADRQEYGARAREAEAALHSLGVSTPEQVLATLEPERAAHLQGGTAKPQSQAAGKA